MNEKGHVSLKTNTLQFVDRAIILRFNAEEMELEILFYKAVEEAELLMTPHDDGKLKIAMSKFHKSVRSVRDDSIAKQVKFLKIAFSRKTNLAENCWITFDFQI